MVIGDWTKPPPKKAPPKKVTPPKPLPTTIWQTQPNQVPRFSPEREAVGRAEVAAAGRLMREFPGYEGNAYYRMGRQEVENYLRGGSTPSYAPSSGGGGGGGRSYGGGGGGGGSATAAAQAQMDYLTGLLNGGDWTADAGDYVLGGDWSVPDNSAAVAANQQLRGRIGEATAADQAAATTAYNNLDQYLNANATNPYADVKVNQARVAPNYNPYLESQGIAPLAPVTENPDDSYGAFQNVLALLGANQQAGQQSRLAESQMGRTFSAGQIGGMDNAFLAAVDTRDAALAEKQQQMQMEMNMRRQQAQMELDRERRQTQAQLDQEKRQAQFQLAELIGLGARNPNTPPPRPTFATTPQDKLGWASIKAAQDWDAMYGGG